MSKKIILIIIAVLIIVGAIIGGIYFFKDKTVTPTTTTTTDSGYKPFNPFGGSGGTNSNTTTDGQVESNVTQTAKFYRITDFSIAGATFYQDKKVLTTTMESAVSNPQIDPKTQKPIPPVVKFDLVPSLRYVERASGHIYNMDIPTKTENKISVSTIPGIYEALFNKDANTVIYRYLSDDRKSINSFMTTLGGAKGEFLPINILGISTSLDKSKFFYLLENGGGVIGLTRSFDKSDKFQVFTSSFTEWIPQWINDSKVFLTTKASASVEGNLFSLDIKSGTLKKVVGGIYGLTTLSNSDGSKVLYSSSLSSGPKLYIFNLKDNSTTNINNYGLPEKCVWSKNDINIYCAIPNTIQGTQYPDSWYQGLISFNDKFIKIDAISGGVSNIINSEEVTAVDATNLFLSDSEEQLFFTNKKDSTLWGLNLY